MSSQLGHGLLDVDGVAGIDNGQVRHPAQDGEVLGGLVAGAVAGGQAGEGADHVDVQVGLGDIEAEEVVRATGGEDRVRRGEGYEAGLGHPGRGAEHQRLGHPHLEEPVRVLLGEDVHVGVLGEIG